MWWLWIIMMVGGLWALFAGRLPMLLFSGFGAYKVEGNVARVIGACLAIPLPLSIVSGFVLAFVVGEDAIAFVSILSLGFTILVALGAVLTVRFARKPHQVVDSAGHPFSPEMLEGLKVVRKKLQQALFTTALGLGAAVVVHAILGPAFFLVAYVLASRAMRLAKEKGVIHRYRDDGNMLRLLSVVLLVFSIVVLVGLII
jgi:hypothetical protein